MTSVFLHGRRSRTSFGPIGALLSSTSGGELAFAARGRRTANIRRSHAGRNRTRASDAIGAQKTVITGWRQTERSDSHIVWLIGVVHHRADAIEHAARRFPLSIYCTREVGEWVVRFGGAASLD